jgi:hypothetical protein
MCWQNRQPASRTANGIVDSIDFRRCRAIPTTLAEIKKRAALNPAPALRRCAANHAAEKFDARQRKKPAQPDQAAPAGWC